MYVFLDTETSALQPAEGSLLTASFIVTNKKLQEAERLTVKIKHAPYKIHMSAMNVNKIDLFKHDPEAIDVATATELINGLFEKWCRNKKSDKFYKLTPVAHYFKFDQDWLEYHLPDVRWWHYLAMRDFIDTKVFANILRAKELLPYKAGTGLEGIMKNFDWEYSGAGAHDSESDTEACMRVFQQFMSM